MLTDNIQLFILIILTGLSVIMIIVGKWRNEDNLRDWGTVIFFINLIIGWVLIGTQNVIKTEEYSLNKSEISVTKTNTSVIVETPINMLIYNKKINFDNIDNDTKFIVELEYNMYNSAIRKNVYYIDKTTLHKEYPYESVKQ
jgi:hypothetical protein